MIYHFVVGDLASEPLKEAVQTEASLRGEVVVLKDILHVGPLKKEEGQSFSTLRSAFWQQTMPQEKSPVAVDDMERLLDVSGSLYKDEEIQAWFWMAPSPADVCGYYWVLPYLSKHPGRFYVVNISGLPFLDEHGKLYYPKSISQILPKELIKARKLARQVTPSEMEVDGDEWAKLIEENAPVRTHEGGKKMLSRPDDFYDVHLLGSASPQFQNAAKVIRQSIGRSGIPTGDIWLAGRIRQLVLDGKLFVRGDLNKPANEFEVRVPGEASDITDSTQNGHT